MATRHVFPQEIINLICEKCEPSTLATLARVSRVFTELALNLLWHTIPDLGPLIRCMPQDLWEVDDGIEFERPRLMFCRSILPADWDRFKVHAARVRKFGFPYTLVDLEPSAYRVLACASVGRLPLLPRLTHIRWLDLTDNVFPYINLFLSPIIICLEFDIISFNDEPDSVGLRFSLLASLVSACPNMAHLTLDGHDVSEEQVPWQEIKSGLSFIEQWSSLHYLEMVGIHDSAILCVTKLPALRTLVIMQACETSEILAAHTKGFPVLESLSISYSTIELCIALLKSMSRTPLRSLRMGLWRIYQTIPWPKLFDAMHRGITHDSLTNISLDWDGGYMPRPNQNNISITFQELRLLLAFTRLSELSIELFGQFKLDNKDLRVMTSAWPRLQTLKLKYLKPSEHLPQITLEGLVSVVRSCPLLENLTLALDAAEVPDFIEKTGYGARSERIRTLDLLHSPIGNPAKVAAFLSDVFPYLCSINLFGDRTGNSWDELNLKWKEAERLTVLFSSVRMRKSYVTQVLGS